MSLDVRNEIALLVQSGWRAIALETLKDVQCTVRDFTADDMATYDKIADFLAGKKITPGKADLSKIIQKGFYVPK